MVLMACRQYFGFDVGEMKQTMFFITGTDTGVGKTVLTALLVRYLRGRGVCAVALKPICSGGRGDARALHTASDGILTLGEINPWHFRAPIAPLLAARCEKERVSLVGVVAHIRALQKRFNVLLIEGAGGLLSPLGWNFNSRALIIALHATPVVVCPNRLGAVNQILLTLEALPHSAAAKARVVFMSPSKLDSSTATNAGLLSEFFNTKKIFSLPWLGGKFDAVRSLKDPRMEQTLRALTRV